MFPLLFVGEERRKEEEDVSGRMNKEREYDTGIGDKRGWEERTIDRGPESEIEKGHSEMDLWHSLTMKTSSTLWKLLPY